MHEVKATTKLAYAKGDKPASALYVSTEGVELSGLSAWRRHMKARSMLRKLPDRIVLPGKSNSSNKKAAGGRGSPSDIMTANLSNSVFEDGAWPQMDTVYINLDRRTDRQRRVEDELKMLGLKSARRFSAKKGDEVPYKDVGRSWHSKLNSLFDMKTAPAELTMSEGERGCAGSHVALWRQCASRDDPTKLMLVLEDDVVLSRRLAHGDVVFPEILHRLTHAVEQIYDVENEPVVLYVGAEPEAWRESREVVVEGTSVVRLREAEYLWQTSSYIIWPTAARELLSHLPVDAPIDCYISKLVLEGHVTAVVASPALVEQRSPYRNSDVDHTNLYSGIDRIYHEYIKPYIKPIIHQADWFGATFEDLCPSTSAVLGGICGGISVIFFIVAHRHRHRRRRKGMKVRVFSAVLMMCTAVCLLNGWVIHVEARDVRAAWHSMRPDHGMEVGTVR
jgi:GR25 family glycosyltransferase involved in LPS biosynthesis